MNNPFKRADRRAQFDAMVADYQARNATLFRKDGRENQNNNIGNAFWRGYHGQAAHWIDPQVPLYVAYVAGREIGKAAKVGTPRTAAQRKADERQRHRAEGRVPVQLWVQPAQVPQVRALEARLQRREAT